jgi:hypothetical protein
MLALLLLVLQDVAARQVQDRAPTHPLPSGYDTQLIRSASGRAELAYFASSRTGDPVFLAVRVEQALLWERRIDAPLELATVDERGWVAGFSWSHEPHETERGSGARGAGELIVYDAAGALKARRAALHDYGWGCMSESTVALDLHFVGASDLLLRANEFTNGAQAPRGECWSILNANDLSDVAHLAPAHALGRPSTPLFLPIAWGSAGEPALDVRTLPGLAVLIVRWPFPNWRAVEGGVELQEDFTVLDLAGRKLAELSHSASERRAEPDPLFNLALPRCRTWRRDEWFRAGSGGRFALVRGLDGAWINYRVVGDADLRRVERAP